MTWNENDKEWDSNTQAIENWEEGEEGKKGEVKTWPWFVRFSIIEPKLLLLQKDKSIHELQEEVEETNEQLALWHNIFSPLQYAHKPIDTVCLLQVTFSPLLF